MNHFSKRTTVNQESVDSEQHYSIDQAVDLLKRTGNAKFKETIDIAINLGIDSKKSDQNVRGSTVLPNGTGKLLRVIVFITLIILSPIAFELNTSSSLIFIYLNNQQHIT